jgi:hypothetical protein
MRWWSRSLVTTSCLSLMLSMGCAAQYADSSAAYHGHYEPQASYAPSRAEDYESAPMPATASSDRARARAGRSQGTTPSRAGASGQTPQAPAPTPDSARPDQVPHEESEPEVAQRQTPLLIYTGTIVLGIFDVARTQENAIALVENAGGFVATRSRDRLVLRVPAEHFRSILNELATLGDVIDLAWQAVDVSEEVRDLDIRLRNAMEVRQRLQDLLARAQSVEDALAIEAQLERITLEIERILGVLRSLEDRIRYSTIEILFRPKHVEQVTQRDYRLPFRWLNELGVERLMRLPEVGQ